MRRVLLLLVLLLPPLLALAACLEFEEQEIHVVVDAERDRLDLLLVYRGLASGPPLIREGEDAEGTEKLLDQIQAGRQIGALLAPWGFFDLTELLDSQDPLAAAFAARVAIDHGEPFRAEDGRLCAWQLIHVGSLVEVLAMGDRWLARSVAEESDAQDFRVALGCDDAASRARWQEAIELKEPWLGVERGALVLHVPASDAAAKSLVRRIESAAAKPRTTEVERRPTKRVSEPEELASLLRSIGVRAVPTARGVDLLLGDPDAPLQRVRFRPSASGARFDLAPRLEQRRIRIRDDVTEATLAAEFAAFRRR